MFKAFILIILISLGMLACSDPAPLKLTAAQRDQLDTLYAQRVIGLGKELDSLCDIKYDTELPRLVDSILKVRKEQENALRLKYERK